MEVAGPYQAHTQRDLHEPRAPGRKASPTLPTARFANTTNTAELSDELQFATVLGTGRYYRPRRAIVYRTLSLPFRVLSARLAFGLDGRAARATSPFSNESVHKTRAKFLTRVNAVSYIGAAPVRIPGDKFSAWQKN